MVEHPLKRAAPNEQGQMILEFVGLEHRLFDVAALYARWPRLAFPQHLKQFAVTPDAISWKGNGRTDADYLYENSRPLSRAELENEVLLLGYENRAPTDEHQTHHVYGVYLAPFSSVPFRLGTSIGGGFAGTDTGNDFTTADLLSWSDWMNHFALSGCAWAIPLVESLSEDSDQLIDTLISEACKRAVASADA